MSTRKIGDLPSRRTRPISRESVFNPSKGLNNIGSPNLIDNKEWADLLNIQMDEGGVVRKRSGYTTFADTLTSARGLGALTTDTLNHLVTIDGTTMKYSSNGGNWTTVATPTFTANKTVTFTQCVGDSTTQPGLLYIWNGTEGGTQWSGSALTRPGTMPRASFSVYYMDRHIAAGVDTRPNRLYIARLTNTSIFTNTSGTLSDATGVPGATVFSGSGANFIDVEPQDGDKITGLGIFQDQCIIFKQFKTYQLTFDDSGDPSVLPITRANGCVSPRSIVSVENDLYFLARDGVRVLGNEPNYFNSIRTRILSKQIDPIIKSMKADSFSKANAVYHDSEYILNVPNSLGELEFTLTYHKDFRGWSKWSNIQADGMQEFIGSDNELSLVFLRENGTQTYKFTPGVYSDDGVPIRSYLLSKVFDFRNPDITKYFVDLGLMFRTISGELNLTIYQDGNRVIGGGEVGIGGNPVIDGMGVSMLGETMLGLGGGTESGTTEVFADIIRRVVINSSSTTIRFRIENERNNENFVLLGYIHAFYPYTHFLFDSDRKIYL